MTNEAAGFTNDFEHNVTRLVPVAGMKKCHFLVDEFNHPEKVLLVMSRRSLMDVLAYFTPVSTKFDLLLGKVSTEKNSLSRTHG